MLALGSLLTGGVFARYPGAQGGVPRGQLQLGALVALGLDERVEKFGDDERFA